MKVNVVTVNSGWILQKMASRLVDCANTNGHEFFLSHSPRNDVDANFYVDVGNCYRGKTATLDLGWFSHIHADDLSTVDRVCLSMDFMFHQAQRYVDMLSRIYPVSKMKTGQLCEANPSFELIKPTIGIFQRGVYEGKGFYFMLALAEDPILKKFKFLFVGTGWDEVVNKMQAQGIECSSKTDEIYDQYSTLYETIDYLLIPSLWEGGPMNVVEAKAKGLPIISADVGWMGSEFPVEYLYPANDIGKLIEILCEIIEPIEKRREFVMQYSYKRFLDELITQINILRGE